MKHSVLFDPSFSMLEVELAPGETLQTEAGSMVSRSENINMATRMNAGITVGFMQKVKAIFIAIVKKVLGGESFFINEFTPTGNAPAKVCIAPTLPGTIIHKKLANQTLMLQGGAFLGSVGNFSVRVVFAGLKALFSGHGLFFLEVTGTGDLFFSAFGGVLQRDIDGTFTLDTGHLVAFEKSLDYKIAGAGNLKSTVFSGEGLVMDFSGKGSLWFQARNVGGLVSFVNPRLPGG